MRRSPLNRQSAKRAAENRERATMLREMFGEAPACAACLPLAELGISRSDTGCMGAAEDAHEPLMRSRGGSITDPDNVIPVSRACHRWIHAHPAAATEAGLLIPTSEK